MPIEATPIVVEPSGDFTGDDGPWSSFLISVGNPPQQLQVLVSTEVSSTWVIAPQACGSAYPANCTGARGGAYDSTKSSTWNVNALYSLGEETNLGDPYNDNTQIGNFGYDTIGVPGQSGAANVSLDNQVIAAIETNTYYLGNLGLSAQNITFNPDSSDTSPSFLGSLKNENLIPSLSFGYTAGASYRQNGTNGSLTLGGYDASRFTPNDVTFNFAPVVTRQLVVSLQSVTYSNSNTKTPLLSQGINALVDSTVPYLWLPESTCAAFQQAFGLTLDPIHNLYTVNDSSHEANIKQNASIVFQLSNSLTGGPSINITLPYASFDLVATAPLVSSQTRYFPLQRGSDGTQYTLGRAFLQESFLIVDYEQSNFSISQATFDASVPSNIVAISHVTTTGTTVANPTSSHAAIVKTPSNSSHGIGTGAIAGIAIAIVLIATLCGSFFIFRNLRRKRQAQKLTMAPVNESKAMCDIESDHKHDFSDEPEVKKNNTATVTIAEVPMTPPLSEADGNEYFPPFGEKQIPQSRIMELPAEPVDRSEMSSPSPEELRSELSTPEPKWSYPELPSPDPSQELPSPGSSSTDSGHPSPDLEQRRSLSLQNRGSALTSLEPRLPQRPGTIRMDSSESEAGWTRDGMPTGPFHRRYLSDESDTPSISSRPRNSRMESSDSEAFIHSNRIGESSAESESPSSSIRPINQHVGSSESESPVSSPSISSSASQQRSIHMDSSSESENSISPAAPRRGGVSSTFHSSSSTRPATTFHSSSSSRPGMRRLSALPRPATLRRATGDSDTWETRLESASDSNSSTAGSRFGSIIIRHQRGESAGNLETREGLLDGEAAPRPDEQI